MKEEVSACKVTNNIPNKAYLDWRLINLDCRISPRPTFDVVFSLVKYPISVDVSLLDLFCNG